MEMAKTLLYLDSTGSRVQGMTYSPREKSIQRRNILYAEYQVHSTLYYMILPVVYRCIGRAGVTAVTSPLLAANRKYRSPVEFIFTQQVL